jgi:uncharacterized surface protein with fasciclin (FAS1) repeats
MQKTILAAVLSFIAVTGTAQAADIVQIAAGNPDFSTLVAAVQAAGLADDLSAPNGPYTVFAPTNEAFARLPAGTVEKLLAPANQDLLVKVLTYHVVSGSVAASQVVTLREATTLLGEPVKINANPSGVRVENANVTATDIFADNGVIHVIDRVILPKGFIGELNRR